MVIPYVKLCNGQSLAEIGDAIQLMGCKFSHTSIEKVNRNTQNIHNHLLCQHGRAAYL